MITRKLNNIFNRKKTMDNQLQYDSTYEVLLAIKEKIEEGGGGGGSVQVVQTTGQSTTAVMSQKATTDALAAAGGGKTRLLLNSGGGTSTEAATFVARVAELEEAGNTGKIFDEYEVVLWGDSWERYRSVLADYTYADGVCKLHFYTSNVYNSFGVQQLVINADGSYEVDNVLDVSGILDNKIGDAPSDGKQYARKDGDWSEVSGGSGGGDYVVVTSLDDVTSPKEGMIARLADYQVTKNVKGYSATTSNRECWYNWALWLRKNEGEECGEVGLVNDSLVCQYRNVGSDFSFFSKTNGNIKGLFFYEIEDDGNNLTVSAYGDYTNGYYVLKNEDDSNYTFSDEITKDVTYLAAGKGEYIYHNGEWLAYCVNQDVLTDDDKLEMISKRDKYSYQITCYSVFNGSKIYGTVTPKANEVDFSYVMLDTAERRAKSLLYQYRSDDEESINYSNLDANSLINDNSEMIILNAGGNLDYIRDCNNGKNIVYTRSMENNYLTKSMVDNIYTFTYNQDTIPVWENLVKISGQNGGETYLKYKDTRNFEFEQTQEFEGINGNLVNGSVKSTSDNIIFEDEDVVWCAGYYDCGWEGGANIYPPFMLGLNSREKKVYIAMNKNYSLNVESVNDNITLSVEHPEEGWKAKAIEGLVSIVANCTSGWKYVTRNVASKPYCPSINLIETNTIDFSKCNVVTKLWNGKYCPMYELNFTINTSANASLGLYCNGDSETFNISFGADGYEHTKWGGYHFGGAGYNGYTLTAYFNKARLDAGDTLRMYTRIFEDDAQQTLTREGDTSFVKL